jgi:hypothetical protein
MAKQRRQKINSQKPVGGTWDDFFALPPLDQDFLTPRNQPQPQERDDAPTDTSKSNSDDFKC